MQKGLILNQNDVKKIIAEHFKITEDKVIQSKYSFIVMIKDKVKQDECNQES